MVDMVVNFLRASLRNQVSMAFGVRQKTMLLTHIELNCPSRPFAAVVSCETISERFLGNLAQIICSDSAIVNSGFYSVVAHLTRIAEDGIIASRGEQVVRERAERIVRVGTTNTQVKEKNTTCG